MRRTVFIMLGSGLLFSTSGCGDDETTGEGADDVETGSTLGTGNEQSDQTDVDESGTAEASGTTVDDDDTESTESGTTIDDDTDDASTTDDDTSTTDDDASTTDDDASTSATDTDTSGTDTGDTDTGDTSDTDTGDTSTTGGDNPGWWLVTLDDVPNPTQLHKIDLFTGQSTYLCSLNTNDGYNTSTFGRNSLLYAANATTNNLEVIDPCTCERTIIGPTMVGALPGITVDDALGLYGLETAADLFVSIDSEVGNATPIGPLGFNWGTGGLTWSDDLGDPYGIDGTTDMLYAIDHTTGGASAVVQLDYNFNSVGMEWHPGDQEIYACSNSAELFHVDPNTGDVTVVGPMGIPGHCDNLAAPWENIACVDDA